MTTQRRGICPVCDREYAVVGAAGVMRGHWAPLSLRESGTYSCKGVGQPPHQLVADPIAAAEERGRRWAIDTLRREADRQLGFNEELRVAYEGSAYYLESLRDREEAS